MMAETGLPPWLGPAWAQLRHYQRQRRLPQALLIHGPAGAGKRPLAQALTAALLCRQPGADGMACGQCADCRLLSADTHPDLLRLTPAADKTGIGVDLVRQLIGQASLKPQYHGHRVILITPAEAMNANAANALLKYLEEPGERTLLLLLAAMPGRLPATVRSRCQTLRLPAPAPALGLAWLRQQRPALGADEAARLLALAQGGPLLALSHADQGVLAAHDACLDGWLQLAGQQAHAADIAEQWLAWPQAPQLCWFARWLLELLKCAHGLENGADPCFPASFQTLARRHQPNPRPLFALYDQVLAGQQRQHTTVNKQLALEELLNHWARLNRNPTPRATAWPNPPPPAPAS